MEREEAAIRSGEIERDVNPTASFQLSNSHEFHLKISLLQFSYN